MAKKSETIGIIYNPISGRGEAHTLASQIEARAKTQGLDAFLCESQASYEPHVIDGIFSSCRAVVVCGGDGTLSTLLPYLAKNKTPVYMVPAGNESLFARGFQMSNHPDQVVAALLARKTSAHYFGTVNGRPFFQMVTVGFDAEVVKRIGAHRHGPINHATYAFFALRQLAVFRASSLVLQVDGMTVIDNESGYLVIANEREYAMRVPVAPMADSLQAKFVAYFYPYQTGLSYLRLLASFITGSHKQLGPARVVSGVDFSIAGGSGAIKSVAVQADGDFVSDLPVKGSIAPGQILVIQPI